MPSARFKLIRVILFAILALLPAEAVLAQTVPGSGWSDPVNLSESIASSSSPSIVADPYGMIHVFWSEDLNGPPHPLGFAPSAGTAIMYRRMKDGVWSDATDLVFGGGGSRVDNPVAVVDSDGILHLAWIQNQTIHYSYVPAWDATSVRLWSKPMVIAEGMIGQLRLLDLGDKRLAVFGLQSSTSPGMYAVHVKKETASAPTLIWLGSANRVPHHIGVAKDGKGRLHAVWSVMQPPSPAALEVRYARSEDGGDTWPESRLVAVETSEENSLQFADPWVGVHGEEEIHLQWAQGLHAYRWHQYSTNGGEDWNKPYQIWQDLLSQTHSQALATDANGNFYWIDILRYPNGAYLIRWENNEWDYPEIFFQIEEKQVEDDLPLDRFNPHAIRVAVALGNQLHIVFQVQDRGEIWTMNKTLSVSGYGPVPIPDKKKAGGAIPTQVSIPVENAGTNRSSELAKINTPIELDRVSQEPLIPLLAGTLPVVLVITIIASRRIKRNDG